VHYQKIGLKPKETTLMPHGYQGGFLGFIHNRDCQKNQASNSDT
jgi:hypothetical protein